MILVGNQRGGARDLALHLMKDENERVEIHQIRGFVADDLRGAFQESEAISRGTRCKQHLFSLSLSPPPEASVSNLEFEQTVDRAEERLGLSGQPRAVVFHEKEGRRHAHAVWCRINPESMTAVQMSHSSAKLFELARELYIEHGWQMPRGFQRDHGPDPRNYTLAEWQQAKRAKKDPARLKEMFQDCWAMSDSRPAFASALSERGYVLAKGDRRGFVAVDHDGEAYAVSRWVGLKAKQVRGRLGDASDLPNTAEAHAQAAKIVTGRLAQLKAEQNAQASRERERQESERRQAEARQRQEAQRLQAEQQARESQEQAERAKQVRGGVLGFLDWLTGRQKRIEDENRRALEQAAARDREAQDRLRRQHAEWSRQRETQAQLASRQHQDAIRELQSDIADLTAKADFAKAQRREQFQADRTQAQPGRHQTRARDGPAPER